MKNDKFFLYNKNINYNLKFFMIYYELLSYCYPFLWWIIEVTLHSFLIYMYLKYFIVACILLCYVVF